MDGKIAVVDGATRAAGRGIARALLVNPAAVAYCTGRSVLGNSIAGEDPMMGKRVVLGRWSQNGVAAAGRYCSSLISSPRCSLP